MEDELVVLEVVVVVEIEVDELDEVDVAEVLEDVVLVVAQVAPKLDAFLKLSDAVPLLTLNVTTSADEIVAAPL